MILIIYIIYISKVTRLVIFLNMSARMFPSTGISNVNLKKKKKKINTFILQPILSIFILSLITRFFHSLAMADYLLKDLGILWQR